MSSDFPDITFSFGDNWSDFLRKVGERSILSAAADIKAWLGPESVTHKSVLDIGCGSGLHSYCFHQLGAERIVSIDVDPRSVATTAKLHQGAVDNQNWSVQQGSILDRALIASLGQFDLVYAWGSLHHTGDMWRAFDNAVAPVKVGGLFWATLYAKTDRYPQELALKQRYNRSTRLGKKVIEWAHIWEIMKGRMYQGGNPLGWNVQKERGMNVYHDLIDWLGGLPYEAATVAEVRSAGERHGLHLLKVDETNACISYLFQRGPVGA